MSRPDTRVVRARPGAYARARLRDLDRALVQALNRARALDYRLPRSRVRELCAALADDLRQVRLLAVEFEPVLDGRPAALVRDLADQLHVMAVREADHRTLAATLTENLARLRSLADEFVEAWQNADTYHRGTAAHGSTGPFPSSSAPVVAPARMAAGLVAHAVRVLPGAHRARWREEFDAELEELAEAAASRWTQVGHASRVAGRVWLLRRALLARTTAGERV